MSDGSVKSLASIVPESFFDVVGRVVPGILVLYVYGQPASLAWQDVVAVLPFAYLIGLSLDFLGSASVEVLLNWIAGKWPRLGLAKQGIIMDAVAQYTDDGRIIGRKMWAECAAFRSIFLFAVFVVISSWLMPSLAPSRVLNTLNVSLQFGLLAVVAVTCHLRIYRLMSAPHCTR